MERNSTSAFAGWAASRATCETAAMPGLPLTFATSADEVDRLPASPAEVAVAGRSNVGKSSLLNALAGRRELARTSKTPGRTQLLNCFVAPNGATVVDLPGYGYAKVSKQQRSAWEKRMRRYLVAREPLVMTLLLVDGEVGPTGLDREVLGWLREHEVPFTVVATKHDKVRSSKRTRRRRELAEACGLAENEPVWVSAQTNVNVDRLRGMVEGWLGLPARPPRSG